LHRWLTRSRAAWLVCGVAGVFFVAMLLSRRMPWKRIAGVVVFAIAGVAAALVIPNALRWRSDNPYLESVQGVVNYEGGSGRGRLVQYQHSLRMAAAHPLLGVGAGNWPVRSPTRPQRRLAQRQRAGTTFNRGRAATGGVRFERGFAAAALLAIAFAMLFVRGLRALRGEEGWEAATLLATITAAGIAGAFDAVLLLALPSFLVFTAMGALECGGKASALESRGWKSGGVASVL
jgi:O-antigen ligase